MYFLATAEGDPWLHFLLLLYFLWFHFVSSCNRAIGHKLHKIKRSDMRYGNKSNGRRLGQRSPVVSTSQKCTTGRPRCHPYWGTLRWVPFFCAPVAEPGAPCPHGVGGPARGVRGAGCERVRQRLEGSSPGAAAKNMSKWSSPPQIESNLMIGDYWNTLLTWVLR